MQRAVILVGGRNIEEERCNAEWSWKIHTLRSSVSSALKHSGTKIQLCKDMGWDTGQKKTQQQLYQVSVVQIKPGGSMAPLWGQHCIPSPKLTDCYPILWHNVLKCLAAISNPPCSLATSGKYVAVRLTPFSLMNSILIPWIPTYRWKWTAR